MSLVVCSLLAETLLNSTGGTLELALRCEEAINRSKHDVAAARERIKNGGRKKLLLMTNVFKGVLLIKFEEGWRITGSSPNISNNWELYRFGPESIAVANLVDGLAIRL